MDKNHFQNTDLADISRTERLVNTSANMAGSNGKSIARSCLGNEAKLDRSYRLIRNENVSNHRIQAYCFVS